MTVTSEVTVTSKNDRLELLTKLYFDEFHICPACGQIYWKGSHYERMQSLIEQIANNEPG